MSPSFTYRITKYDPADFAESGAYNGAEEEVSNHGPVEAAYLAAAAAFAEASGVERLDIRESEVPGFVNFGLEAPVEGHGLSGLFPPDLTGYHDGAEVSLPVALEVVRAMLRDNGAWCRLEAGNARCTSGTTSMSTWEATGPARRPWPGPGNSACSRLRSQRLLGRWASMTKTTKR